MVRRLSHVASVISFAAIGAMAWQNDLTPIAAADWNAGFAAHLLERAGFGGTPDEIAALAKLTPRQAVARLVRFEGVDSIQLPPFDESPSTIPASSRSLPAAPPSPTMAKRPAKRSASR
jgi:hypothetical protein